MKDRNACVPRKGQPQPNLRLALDVPEKNTCHKCEGCKNHVVKKKTFLKCGNWQPIED